ncbi:hypothetical protein EDC01DRAFT_671421 [Geopyxis carbonaria]|nr:hypothetical protein EDC01DRAFT_671421 [Geopyxis carbonaria]
MADDSSDHSTAFIRGNPDTEPDSDAGGPKDGAISSPIHHELQFQADENDSPPASPPPRRSASPLFPSDHARSPSPPPRPRRPTPVKGRTRGDTNRGFTASYIALLNSEIRSAAQRDIYTPSAHSRLRTGSFIGGSWWSVDEKEVFFNHLAVLGKDGVEEIAAAVGSKSIVECLAYIQELHRGAAQAAQHVRSRARDMGTLRDIPAAVEVDEKCEAALERQAEALEAWTEKNDSRRERRAGGECWLFDEAVAEKVGGLVTAGEAEAVQEMAPEAELLDVAKMLELSRTVFMNSPTPAAPTQPTPAAPVAPVAPAIRYSAVQELHTLVTGLTRRLVATSLFLSESRQRATATTLFNPQPVVRRSDVCAAIETLDLPHNKLAYWTALPRRTGLSVVQRKLEMNYRDPRVMPYGAVEARLAKVEAKHVDQFFGDDEEALESAKAVAAEAERRMQKEEEEGEDSSGEEDGESAIDDDAYASDISDATRHLLASERRREERTALLADAEDEYLARLDAAETRRETRRLWKLVDDASSSESSVSASSASSSDSESSSSEDSDSDSDSDNDTRPPRTYVKHDRAVLDWREGIEYFADWEVRPPPKRSYPDTEVDADADSNADDADAKVVAKKGRGKPRAKRRKVDHDDDDTEVDGAKKARAKKRRKVDRDEDDEDEEVGAVESEVEVVKKGKGKATGKGKGKGKKVELEVKKRSPRAQRKRRQSAVHPAYVSTVDALAEESDGEVAPVVDHEEEEVYVHAGEEEDEDEYQE